MSDLRKAAEMALEALEQTPTVNKLFDSESYEKQKDAIDALRQALAQLPCQTGSQCLGGKCPECVPTYEFECPRCGHCCQQRKWVDLTDDEINHTPFRFTMINGPGDGLLPFAKAVMAKLKEKNT